MLLQREPSLKSSLTDRCTQTTPPTVMLLLAKVKIQITVLPQVKSISCAVGKRGNVVLAEYNLHIVKIKVLFSLTV